MQEFAKMVEDVRNAKKIMAGPDYELTAGEKASTAFRRSIFAVEGIKKGEEFSEENISIVRPGYGLAPKYFHDLIGKKATRDIGRGEPITKADLDQI